MLTTPRRALLASLVALSAVAPSQRARADGDEAFSVLLHERAPGLGITSAGAGFSARRPGGEDMPVSERTLEVTGVPAGSAIQHAYLYWIVYGPTGDDTLTFGVSEPYASITGTVIGTSADTCWPADFPGGAPNRTYRADVTAHVAGNGSYRVADLASGEAAGDTQGVSLVIVYDDPADTALGTVILEDGAITTRNNREFMSSFTGLVVGGEVLEASLRFGAGDGQSALQDDDVELLGDEVPVPGFNWWIQRDGAFWDDVVADVTSRITPGLETADYRVEMDVDCVVFAYAALAYREVAAAAEDAGVSADAGESDASVSADAGTGTDAGTALDASAAIDAGGSAFDASAAIDAGGPIGGETDGCGCRVGARSRPVPALLLATLALAALFARRRAR